MGVFLPALFCIIIGGIYAFDINGLSSRRKMPVFARVIGWIFFVAGTFLALLVLLAWIFSFVPKTRLRGPDPPVGVEARSGKVVAKPRLNAQPHVSSRWRSALSRWACTLPWPSATSG